MAGEATLSGTSTPPSKQNPYGWEKPVSEKNFKLTPFKESVQRYEKKRRPGNMPKPLAPKAPRSELGADTGPEEVPSVRNPVAVRTPGLLFTHVTFGT